MKFRNYYQTLGLERDASQDQIKRAYRGLARKLHPDINKEADAEKRFKEVGEAYEVLKDPEKRAAYDQFGDNYKQGQDFSPPPNWDSGFEYSGGSYNETDGFSDFFEQLFGRRSHAHMYTDEGREIHLKGNDHLAKVKITLEDAYSGHTVTLTLSMAEVDANGHVVTKPHTLNVKIPKGITEGQQIRLAGQGGPGMGKGERGDLYLEVVFQSHKMFKIKKKDIILELPVTPWEVALGKTVTVPTLGGSVDLKIPAGSQSGLTLRLKGRGLPGPQPGDQMVLLKIVTPKAEDDTSRALYEQMAKEMPFNPRQNMGV